MEIAALFDAMILLRMIVAYWRRETGLAWMPYAALCLTSFLWLHWLTDLILQPGICNRKPKREMKGRVDERGGDVAGSP